MTCALFVVRLLSHRRKARSSWNSIDRLRLRSGEDFLEARIASQRVPFPAQTKVGQRDCHWMIRPLNEPADVNDPTNIDGAGINIAQRVMNCGDAGHILLSKRVTE